MLREMLVFVAGSLMAAGMPVAAAEGPDAEKGIIHAVQHHEEHSEGKKEEAKDPLQFGSLKVGLDTMFRGESANNFNFTDFSFAPGGRDSRLLIRVRPALTYTPAEYLTARIEGQLYGQHNDTDSDTFRLYQGYLEGGLPNKKAVIKAGRQELVYGSTFMLGNDTFFDGLSFDAVKLAVKPADTLQIDIFAGKYTKDNSGGITGEMYGIYGTSTLSEELAVDLYALLDTGGQGLTHEGKDERTYSVGARLVGKLDNVFTLEVEPVYQFGRHIEASSHHYISAFGGHIDLAANTQIGRHPAKGIISYAFGSGDGNAAEGKFSEFHNPNNDTSLIGDMSVVSDMSGVTATDRAGNKVHASGLHVVTAGGGVDLTEKFNLSLDGHYFRAVKTPAGVSKEVGFETNLVLSYKITDSVCLLASVNRFFTGGFFKDATGSDKDINYGYLQLQATF